jgi:GAF domain-containing protein
VPDIAVAGAYVGRLREVLLGAGVRALLAVPMLREGRLLGSLVVNHHEPGEFPAEKPRRSREDAHLRSAGVIQGRNAGETVDPERDQEQAEVIVGCS